MKRIAKFIAVLGLLASTAYGFTDSDFDGVSDSLDKCPNSSIEDIVNSQGCVDKSEYSVSLGESLSNGAYGGTDFITTANTNLVLGLKIKNWSLSSAFSYFSSGPADPTVTTVSASNGLGDTYLSLGYADTFGAQSQWTIALLASAKLATADITIGTGESDYGMTVSTAYSIQSMSLIGSLGYTVTGDTLTIIYNDIKNVSFGAGYMFGNKLYMSISYAYSDAYTNTTVATQAASIFSTYIIDEKWNASITYSRGLSDSAAENSVSLMLTRKFK